MHYFGPKRHRRCTRLKTRFVLQGRDMQSSQHWPPLHQPSSDQPTLHEEGGEIVARNWRRKPIQEWERRKVDTLLLRRRFGSRKCCLRNWCGRRRGRGIELLFFKVFFSVLVPSWVFVCFHGWKERISGRVFLKEKFGLVSSSLIDCILTNWLWKSSLLSSFIYKSPVFSACLLLDVRLQTSRAELFKWSSFVRPVKSYTSTRLSSNLISVSVKVELEKQNKSIFRGCFAKAVFFE